MSQNKLATIVPTVDTGTTLSNALNTWADAIETSQSGTTPPAAPQAGNVWFDTTPAVKALKIFDGTTWVKLAALSAVSTPINYVGAKDTTAAIGTYTPAKGDLVLVNADGTVDASWTGAAGSTVAIGDSLFYDGTNWDVLAAKADLYKTVHVFDNITDAKAAALADGDIVDIPSRGNARYQVMPASYTPLAVGYGDHTMGSGKHLKLLHDGEVNVLWFGAKGDGVTDDTDPVQSAIRSDANTVTGAGTFRVRQTKGVSDYYGLVVDRSDLLLSGDITILRLDDGISVLDKAFAPLFIGKPDSDLLADMVDNVVVDGWKFIGSDIRHSTAGNTEPDKRYAIEVKNTRNVKIINCTFDKIDSQAICFQVPYTKNLVSAVYYNNTKSEDAVICNCTFNAEPHTDPVRALIRAVSLRGLDGLTATGNTFNWCDDGFNGAGTYEFITESRNATYATTDAGWTGGAVKRSGRDWNIANNHFNNSSEHSVYLSGVNVVVTGNTVSVDDPNICQGDFKVRSKGTVISGNSFSGCVSTINVAEPSLNVVVSGNSMDIPDKEYLGGAIEVNSQGIESFIDSRDYLSSYTKMEEIVISGNTIVYPDADAASEKDQAAVRVVTDSSLTHYPEGNVIQGLIVSGNIIKNAQNVIVVHNQFTKNCSFDNNVIIGKPFSSTGFSTATRMGSKKIFAVSGSGSGSALGGVLIPWKFNGNSIQGFEQIFGVISNVTATSLHIPRPISANSIEHIKEFSASNFRTPTHYNCISGNYGNYVLDRSSWRSNYLSDSSFGNGTDSDSFKLDRLLKVSDTSIRLYTDDSGTFKTITLT